LYLGLCWQYGANLKEAGVHFHQAVRLEPDNPFFRQKYDEFQQKKRGERDTKPIRAQGPDRIRPAPRGWLLERVLDGDETLSELQKQIKTFVLRVGERFEARLPARLSHEQIQYITRKYTATAV